MRVLLLLAGALLVGCSAASDLETYCEATGTCRCASGDCCVLLDNACNSGACCSGLTCQNGTCVGPRLVGPDQFEATPWPADAGTGPFQSISFENSGIASTGTLAATLSDDSNQFAIQDHCSGTKLQPNGTCTVDVALAPAGNVGNAFAKVIVVDDFGARTQTTVHGYTSGSLSVFYEGSGIGSVTATVPLTYSATGCDTGLLPAGSIVLTAHAMSGSSFEGWFQTDFVGQEAGLVSSNVDLPLTIGGESYYAAHFDAFVTFDSPGPVGALNSTSGIPIKCDVDAGHCTQAFSGTENLTYSPPSGYRFTGWGGACASAGTNPSCHLKVTGPTNVVLDVTPN